MKKILLVYPPFCTPASPPYSITNLYSFLKGNSTLDLEVLDLNLEFHKRKFPEYQKYYQDNTCWNDYDKKTLEYNKLTGKVYSENNRQVVVGKKPDLLDEMLHVIKEKKPDIIAFSIVYSSQAFYALALLRVLKDKITVIGGPAVNSKLTEGATSSLNNEVELLEYITGNKIEPTKLVCNAPLDFSIYNLSNYFTPKAVIPIKTSTTCFYQKCSFCAHYSKGGYMEYPIDQIVKTITYSKQKIFFFIDDTIPVKRLLKIAQSLKPLNVHWACQLRPTKEFDYNSLKILRESGLIAIFWGVESGNQRILNLMNKGTIIADVETVLSDSHMAGITNGVYIMFGFPSETKPDFLDTISLLKKNSSDIDLVLTSVFGLHRGTEIYLNPSKFGISKIIEHKRTVLDPKIDYEIDQGLTQSEASRLRERYSKTIESINKFPKNAAFFREHLLVSVLNSK